MQVREALDPATLVGRGKLEEIRAEAEARHVPLVIVDHNLTPVQLRNMEKGTDCRVIDRTQLILDIFATHARTPRRPAASRARAAKLSAAAPHRHAAKNSRAWAAASARAARRTKTRNRPPPHSRPRQQNQASHRNRSPPTHHAPPRAPSRAARHGRAGRLHERRKIHALQRAHALRRPHLLENVRDARSHDSRRAPSVAPPRPAFRHGRFSARSSARSDRRFPRHARRSPGSRADPAGHAIFPIRITPNRMPK